LANFLEMQMKNLNKEIVPYIEKASLTGIPKAYRV
jgi:hypothetical protein